MCACVCVCVPYAGFVLLGKTLEELEALVTQFGQPRYRAKQLLDGVLQGARSVGAIKTLPKELQTALIQAGVKTGRSVLHKVRLPDARVCMCVCACACTCARERTARVLCALTGHSRLCVPVCVCPQSVRAPDGTCKFLLQLHDGRVVETVGIPNDEDTYVSSDEWGTKSDAGKKRKRLTVCVSSQVRTRTHTHTHTHTCVLPQLRTQCLAHGHPIVALQIRGAPVCARQQRAYLQSRAPISCTCLCVCVSVCRSVVLCGVRSVLLARVDSQETLCPMRS